MINNSLQTYSVSELNLAIGELLQRGFAPRFLLQAHIAQVQKKKGHLWLTFSDGKSCITGVVWSSILKKLDYIPSTDDGVIVVGKVNFWEARATLSVQVLDIRPSRSTVLRQFEIVRELLIADNLINEDRRRTLPKYPRAIAILTSVPSSALADMLRTSKERWPFTKLFIIPISVQGDASAEIMKVLSLLAMNLATLKFDAIVLARGGGNREDLMLFDNENLCRKLANFPVPVVTGIGHEDDLTIADLVADHRAATPTAALVALLPSKEIVFSQLLQTAERIEERIMWSVNKEKQRLRDLKSNLVAYSPEVLIKHKKSLLDEKFALINAFSPQRWLSRGLAIVRNDVNKVVHTVKDLNLSDSLTIQISDGEIDVTIKKISPYDSSS